MRGGSVVLTALDGYAGRAGDRFQLLQWTHGSGAFGAVDLHDAPLGDGLRWDASRLNLDGSVSVVAVPEPASVLLWGAGLTGIARALRSRRARTRAGARGRHAAIMPR